MKTITLMGCFIGTVLSASLSFGWSNSSGVSVCTGNFELEAYYSTQEVYQVVSDGSGGAIIVWKDSRQNIPVHQDIYIARVDSTGNSLWGVNGLAVCTSYGSKSYLSAAGDGSGGVYVTWTDKTSLAIDYYYSYAQHVNSVGSTLWDTNGMLLGINYPSYVASDGQGGAYLFSNGSTRRVTSDGSTLWMIKGGSSMTIPDTSNGLIGLHVYSTRYYAQDMDSSGNMLWGTSTGVDLGFNNTLNLVNFTGDGSNGFYIAWRNNNDIFAQRYNSQASSLWNLTGVAICTGYVNGGSSNMMAAIIPDGTGGAYVTWDDYRSTSAFFNGSGKVYVQRVSSEGSTLWVDKGISICTVGYQSDIQMSPDGSGGAIISWEGSGIYAQRIDQNGNSLWDSRGVQINNGLPSENGMRMVPGNSNGQIFTWRQGSTQANLLAQSLDSNGAVPVEISSFRVEECNKP